MHICNRGNSSICLSFCEKILEGKQKTNGKNIAVTGFIFEDPEGQPKLPLSLSTSLTEWKRPHEYLTEQNVYIDGSNKRLDR